MDGVHLTAESSAEFVYNLIVMVEAAFGAEAYKVAEDNSMIGKVMESAKESSIRLESYNFNDLKKDLAKMRNWRSNLEF
jgi:hypothetical protein